MSINIPEVQKSMALANAELKTGSLSSLLSGGFIRIYKGTIPAGPEEAVGAGMLLCKVTGPGSAGLTFDGTVTNGVLQKDPAIAWGGTNEAISGDATFWRWNLGSDDNSAVADLVTGYRLQGTCGVGASYSMFLANVAFVASAAFVLDAFQYVVPAGA